MTDDEPVAPTALRLAPGSGHVARRTTAVLFLPEPDARVLDAFGDGLDGAELQAVASATVAAGFDVARYVAVSWRPDRVQVMAFGDIAVETDQPTLPMLSGAGSRTWVEHSLTPAGPAAITVAGEAVDAASDLRAGVAPAGGFRLELAPATSSVSAELASPSEAVVGPDPTAPTTATAPTAGPDPTEPTVALPPAIDVDDAEAALAAIQAAAMGEDGTHRHPEGAAASPAPPVPAPGTGPDGDPDVTLPPPDVGELLADLAGPAAGGRALVEAKLCSHQHPNPPTVATCEICGELLPPGTATVVHVARPRLGALRLDDGSIIPLDHELVIGRKPSPVDAPDQAAPERVKVAGDKVSRTHLEVRFQGWDVVVADCGSTNGTFVVPHAGGPVLTVDPARPQLVEPGAAVYFGSRSFTVLDRGEAAGD